MKAPLGRDRLMVLVAGILMLAVVVGMVAGRSSAEGGRALPAPAVDDAGESGASATAVFAGGCFWGVQGVFQHVAGVTDAVSGYAGGSRETATYHQVAFGRTQHAEAVRIAYDPRQVSYGTLLQILFSVAHDPTQLDRQGPDVGPQYRSAIFPQSAAQARIAAAYIAQLDGARAFPKPIVTRIEPDHPFHRAEDHHQDFMARNPTHPYVVIHDQPKIADLKRLFPDAYRAEPVLVATGAR